MPWRVSVGVERVKPGKRHLQYQALRLVLEWVIFQRRNLGTRLHLPAIRTTHEATSLQRLLSLRRPLPKHVVP